MRPISAIVLTMYVATVSSRLRARARFLVSLCLRRRCSALPRRLHLRANNCLLSVNLFLICLSLSPFLPCILVSRRGFSRPTPHSPAHLPSPERIWCSFADPSPPSRFPRRYASFGAMAVGTNGLAYGFNWQCTADAISYAASWSWHTWTLYPSPHFHGLSLPRPRGGRGRVYLDKSEVCPKQK